MCHKKSEKPTETYISFAPAALEGKKYDSSLEESERDHALVGEDEDSGFGLRLLSRKIVLVFGEAGGERRGTMVEGDDMFVC
jgi:hypothetical protein